MFFINFFAHFTRNFKYRGMLNCKARIYSIFLSPFSVLETVTDLNVLKRAIVVQCKAIHFVSHLSRLYYDQEVSVTLRFPQHQKKNTELD